jgi:hypothetical protein
VSAYNAEGNSNFTNTASATTHNSLPPLRRADLPGRRSIPAPARIKRSPESHSSGPTLRITRAIIWNAASKAAKAEPLPACILGVQPYRRRCFVLRLERCNQRKRSVSIPHPFIQRDRSLGVGGDHYQRQLRGDYA